MIDKNTHTAKIEVSNVTRYAYGQFDNGDYAIWALGEAGWFEIRPGKGYKQMFDDMIEGIDIFYFLKDTYSWSDSEKISAKKLFAMYAKDHPDRARNATAAADLAYKHRVFLAKTMKKEDKEMKSAGWANTPFYEHMKEKFPEMLTASPRPRPRTASVRSNPSSLGSGRIIRTRSIRTASQAGGNADNVSTTSSHRRGLQSHMPTEEELEAKAKRVWKHMLKLTKGPNGRTNTGAGTLATFADKFYVRYNFETKDDSADYMRALAPQLLPLLAKTTRETWGAAKFFELPIYEELKSAKLPAVTKKRMLLHEMEENRGVVMWGRVEENVQEKKGLERVEKGEVDESGSEEEGGEETTSVQRPKSALRPKGSKFADKGRGKRAKSKFYRNSLPVEDEQAEEEAGGSGEDEAEEDSVMEDVSSPSKRKGEDVDIDTRLRKRAASGSHDIEGIQSDDDEDDAAASGSDSEVNAASTALPLRRKPEAPMPVSNGGRQTSRSESHMRDTRSQPQPPIPVSPPPIVSETIPRREPNGPEDTWTCGVDGCVHKVYGVDKDLGKRLVKEHIAEHEGQRKSGAGQKDGEKGQDGQDGQSSDVLALIRMEEDMCHLPVRYVLL